MLRQLQAGRHWIWIAGNHDPVLPEDLGGARHDALAIGNIILRHEPSAQHDGFEIAGHLHPVARVAGSTGSIRRRCFLSDRTRCILPAFGAYAGGLNLHDRAFAPLFASRERIAHVMGRERVYRISTAMLAGLGRRKRYRQCERIARAFSILAMKIAFRRNEGLMARQTGFFGSPKRAAAGLALFWRGVPGLCRGEPDDDGQHRRRQQGVAPHPALYSG